MNTILTDPEGTVVFEISSKYHLRGSETTIKKGDHILATIHWRILQRSTITWNGRTTTIKEIFPRDRTLTMSRVYTAPDGKRFKWRDKGRLYCVSLDNGLHLAAYDRVPLRYFQGKKSKLEITPTGAQLTDTLIVTWAIAEKKARDRRRSRRNGGGNGGN